MSRRTAESSKAIRQAWQKERERVLAGQGTRDWTPEQQQDIIEKGKAYDADGRAFEGQHMKSAEKYPEYQGDPDNIQFLTKKEHLDAHRGNWQNPTNWYYDPVTYEFTDFGDGKFIPCTVIDLSEPIVFIASETNAVKEQPQTDKTATSPDKTKSSSPTHTNKSKPTAPPTKTTPASSDNDISFFTRAKARLQSAGKGIAGFGKKVASGAYNYRKEIAAVVLPLIGLAAEETKRRSASQNSNNSPIENDDTDSLSSSDYDYDESENDITEPDEERTGTPKKPHDRTGYWGDRWKKDENGNRYKSPSWISPAKIHPEQMDDEESEDE